MQRIVGTATVVLALMLAGCDIPGLVSVTGKPASNRPTGKSQVTTISLLKYKNALFRDKTSGKLLAPNSAAGKPPEQVELEAGDFEELLYDKGRMRYAFYGRETEAQPFVTERTITDAEFEALDKAIWDDKYFGLDKKVWDGDIRLPMFYLRYNQEGKGHEVSLAPTLNKLRTSGKILERYLKQMNGEDTLPANGTMTAYYLNVDGGKLNIGVATQKKTDADLVETDWKIKSASVDMGKGFQAATVDAKGETFSVTLPTADKPESPFQLMGIKLTTEGGPGDWETVIPYRAKK